jgi:diguanylate cyclase (GGDEF)-like protein
VDPLTGVADTGELMVLEAQFDRDARAGEFGRSYGMALVDVTGLRKINERYGPEIGDVVLMTLAQRLQSVDPDACVARVGGDEFAVLVDGNGPSENSQLAHSIQQKVNFEPLVINGQKIPLEVRVTTRSGPNHEFQYTNLLWAVQRAVQTLKRLDFEQRLDALEKVAMATLLSEQADFQTRLELVEQQARTDELTGLLNRWGLQKLLPSLAAPYSVAFIDIDNLRELNSSQGNWAAGDQALRGVARLLCGLSPRAVVVRWGGDEFLVLLPDATAPAAREAIELLLSRPELHLRISDLPVTFSGGVAYAATKEEEPKAMVMAQETAQEAKAAGKSQIWLARGPRPPEGESGG